MVVDNNIFLKASSEIPIGYCVIFDTKTLEIFYAGPIAGSQAKGYSTILVNPKDFEYYRKFVQRTLH